MTTFAFSFSIRALLAAGVVLACCGVARAEGRPGAVEWSDGHKLAGAISLTPGKTLRIFTSTTQVSLALAQVKEIRFKPEKEEMWEGFYFPDAGQATQVKTGEVYPIRYLQTQVTLADGNVVEGHLFTTTLYVESDDTTQKIVLMAKQSGANGQKLTDLVYPTLIRFDAGGTVAASTEINLSDAGFVPTQPPVVVAQPDLALLPMEKTPGKPIWSVPSGNPGQILFAVEAGDGVHVAWPETQADPAMPQAVEDALKVMRDFYDTRALLGCFTDADAGDAYSLVMMKRLGKSVDGDGKASNPNIIPWSLVILRWKYDPEQKKATLLNRVLLKIGRTEGNSAPPAVFKQAGLLKDISGKK